MRKKNILFHIYNVGSGGAERCLIELFHHYNKSEFSFQLLTNEKQSDDYSQLLTASDFVSEADLDFTLKQGGAFRMLLQQFLLVMGVADHPYILRLYYVWLVRPVLKQAVRHDFDLTDAAVDMVFFKFYKRNWKYVYRISKAVGNKKPDVLVGSLIQSSNALIWFAKILHPGIFKNVQWVAIEQVNTKAAFEDVYRNEELTFWMRFSKLVFQKADTIVAVSEGVKQGLVRYFDQDPSKIAVVYNPVNVEAVNSVQPIQAERSYLMGIGRIENQKQFHLLVEAFAIVSGQIDVNLLIMGKGSLLPVLKKQVDALGLTERIHFNDFSLNVWSYLKAAEALVMSSKFEGSPLIMVEAMAAGTPVISFDCEYGPSEIIEHQTSGLLVEADNVTALADAIKLLLNDAPLRERLGKGALKRSEMFDSNRITLHYQELFNSVIN
jgi:glycosyltransferase involved in cell wall biosynthesis